MQIIQKMRLYPLHVADKLHFVHIKKIDRDILLTKRSVRDD